MSIARRRGICLHCGHDHDADDLLMKARLLSAAQPEAMPTEDEIRLACGEMTPAEMRTVKAALGWFSRKPRPEGRAPVRVRYTPIFPTKEQVDAAWASGLANLGDVRLVWVVEGDFWTFGPQPIEMLVPSSPQDGARKQK